MSEMTYHQWRQQLELAFVDVRAAEDGCGHADWLAGPPQHVVDRLSVAMNHLRRAHAAAAKRAGEANL